MGRIHVCDACVAPCDDPESQMVVPIVPVKMPLSPPRTLACKHYTRAAAHDLKAAADASVFVPLYE
jgi:hypothetical protein